MSIPTFGKEHGLLPVGAMVGVTAADFNGDGNLDVIITTQAPGIYEENGNGAGVFSYGLQDSHTPTVLITADLSGTGRSDIIYTAGNNVVVWHSNGVNWSQHYLSPYNQTSYAAGTSPSGLAVADINGDGRPDIVVANTSAVGTVSVLYAKAGGGFSSPVSYATGSTSPYHVGYVETGDFNNDGHQDIVTSNGSNSLSLLLMNGNGTISETKLIAIPGSSGAFGIESIAVADFNHDGNADIAVALYYSGVEYFRVLLGNGLGGFSVGPLTGYSNFVAEPISVADVNGDGNPDIVLGGNVYFGDGSGGMHLGIVPSGSTMPAAAAFADLNGDGLLDKINFDGSVQYNTTGSPPPVFLLASTPIKAAFGTSINIGSATPGVSGDHLTAYIIKDTLISSGSSIAIDAAGNLTYNPGSFTSTQSGNDLITFRVSDTDTGVSIDQTITVDLSNTVTLDPGTQQVVVDPAFAYVGGGGDDEFVVDASTIGTTIDGGTGASSLTVIGGGTVTMPDTISNIGVVRLIASATSAPYDFTANQTAGLIIFASTGPDVIQAGNGSDVILLQAAGTTVQGGTGNDTVKVTVASIASTIDGGGGHDTLVVDGGGTAVMGSGITGFAEVHLGNTQGASTNFNANTTAGLVIVGSHGNDVIGVGNASQTVYGFGDNTVVNATAATAGARVVAITGTTTLRIDGGGVATLGDSDSHGLIVQLDQATLLNMGHTAFITAIAETAGSTLVAQQAFQTLVSLAGGTTMIGATAQNTYADTFKGTASGLNGDTIVNFGKSDVIDITDVLPQSSIVYTQGTGTAAGHGTLSFGGASLTLTGTFNAAKLQILSDGDHGTLIKYLG